MLPIYIALLYYWLVTRLVPGLYRQWKTRKLVKAKRRVIVLSRYPRAGKTKTRLIDSLGASGAATLQLLMTDHILTIASKLYNKIHDFCVELRYYGGDEAVANYWLNRREPFVVHRPQRGKDLGEIMPNAIKEAFKEGAKSVILIGSDIPGIDVSILRTSFKELDNDFCDTVIGKARDGGYYLIGVSNSVDVNKIDDFFSGIHWGTDVVFEQQTENAKKLGISQIVLSQTLADVDTKDDLAEVEKHLGITVTDITRPSWSIVIPVFNDSQSLHDCVQHIVKNADYPERLEIVVADGQSTDNPMETVGRLKEELKSKGTRIKIVFSEKGRGSQLITGSESTTHQLLMYVHADSRVPKHFDTLAWHTLIKPGVVAGAFRFGVDAIHNEKKRRSLPWWFIQKMRLLEWGTRRRASKYELPYGDQGLFMWRKTYDTVGGFKNYRLFEDYDMVTRLKKHGHIALVTGPPLITSSRRWEKHGYIKITGMNTLLVMAYKCGVSPETLARWYYGQ